MRSVLLLLTLLWTVISNAQSDTTATQGEIVSGEVIIEKNKQIVLPKADKRFQPGSLKAFDSDPLEVNLTVFKPELQWPPYKSDVQPVAVDPEYPVEEYLNYLKLGYGNFGSPMAELGLFEKVGVFDVRNKISYESFARGPVNGTNSGSSVGRLDLSGTYRKERLSVTPYLGFDHQTYRFYGNTDRANPGFDAQDLPKVRWSQVRIGTRLSGGTKQVTYSVDPNFYTISQTPEAGGKLNSESSFAANGSLKLTIDDQFDAGFEMEGFAGTFGGGVDYDRSLFLVNPWLRFSKENVRLTAGFNVASGKSSGVTQSGFYPDVKAEWSIENEWSVYALLNGGIDWLSLSDLLNENEFLDDSLQLLNIENKFSLGGGIKGSLFSNLFLDINLTYSDLENLPYYIPSSTDSSRYTMIYDTESTQRLRLFSKLTYSPSTATIIGASLEVNSYSVAGLDRPWHQPAFILEGFASHNLKQKVILSGHLKTIGGIRAPSTVDFGIENLKTIVDLGLEANFLLTERLSAFVLTDNILNNEYERYLGFPVRGITFKIGGQYRF